MGCFVVMVLALMMMATTSAAPSGEHLSRCEKAQHSKALVCELNGVPSVACKLAGETRDAACSSSVDTTRTERTTDKLLQELVGKMDTGGESDAFYEDENNREGIDFALMAAGSYHLPSTIYP